MPDTARTSYARRRKKPGVRKSAWETQHVSDDHQRREQIADGKKVERWRAGDRVLPEHQRRDDDAVRGLDRLLDQDEAREAGPEAVRERQGGTKHDEHEECDRERRPV